MTDDQKLAYAAGIIDGEGCISTHVQKDVRHLPSVYVKVCMTDSRPIMLLQSMFGGPVRYKVAKIAHHRPQYVWDVSATRAEVVLKALLPFLIVKKEQAEKGLAIRALVIGRGKRLSKEREDEGQRLRAEIKVLNARGPTTA